uniref:Inhibitor I9 domain-containing protein n=1 Tax=Oryza rufipogon TaxID=4529 RepID=A0A0E0P7U2_ORYRU
MLEAEVPEAAFVEPPPLGHGDGEDNHRRWHESFQPLSEFAGSDDEPRLVHSYTEVVSGFATRLTDGELDAVSKKHPGTSETWTMVNRCELDETYSEPKKSGIFDITI